jgi:hypothetical protein
VLWSQFLLWVGGQNFACRYPSQVPILWYKKTGSSAQRSSKLISMILYHDIISIFGDFWYYNITFLGCDIRWYYIKKGPFSDIISWYNIIFWEWVTKSCNDVILTITIYFWLVLRSRVHGSALATFVYLLPFNSSLYGTAPLASCAKIVCFDFAGRHLWFVNQQKVRSLAKFNNCSLHCELCVSKLLHSSLVSQLLATFVKCQ